MEARVERVSGKGACKPTVGDGASGLDFPARESSQASYAV
jgi:hypothetical protein